MNKVLVFDFDGTVVDSMHIWNTFAYEYLQYKNRIVPKDIARTLDTMTLVEGIEYLKDTFSLPMDIKEIEKDMMHHIQERFINEATLKIGISSFIKDVHSKNIPMYILTANTKEIVSILLKKYQLDTYISDIYTCDILKMNKNTETIFLHVASILSINPKDMIVFEDTYQAALSAKKAGCLVIGVKDSYQQKEIVNVVDTYITDFTEMEKWT